MGEVVRGECDLGLLMSGVVQSHGTLHLTEVMYEVP